MDNVMDLIAKIGLDDSEYNKKLDSDKSSFSNFGSSIASGAKTVMKAGVAAFTAVGTAIGGATTALISNAKETASYADNIDKMSQKIGFTAEAFQEWDFIMQHNGSSIDAVKIATKSLANNLEKDTEAFEKLGLSQEELLSMNAEQRFEATVTALQNVEDETERASLANDVFGRSYQELGPLLNMSAEETEAMKQQVHDLGGVMSDDAVKAGAQFQDSLQNLQTALTGAKNNLMGEFLPSMSTVMDGLSALFSGDDSGIGKIKEGIVGLAEKLNEALPKALETVGGIAESLISALPAFFDTISQQLPTLISTLIPVVIDAVVSLADAVVTALPGIMDAIQKNISVISNGLKKIFTALGQIIIKLVPSLLPVLLKVGVELVTELARGFAENASEVIGTVIELINMVVVELTNPDTLMLLLECGIQILTALVNGIAENLPLLLETAGTLITNLATFLVEAIPDLVVAIGKNGATIITEVLPQIITSIGQAGADLLLKISGVIAGWIPDLISDAKDAFESLGQGILNAWDWIKEKVMNIGTNVLTTIQAALSTIFEVGKNLVQGLWNGIKDAKDWVLDKIKGFGEDVLSGIKSFFGISSPSKKTAYFGEMLAEGLAVGVEDEAPDAFREIQGALDDEMDNLELSPISPDIMGTVRVDTKYNNPIMQGISALAEMIKNFADQDWEITIPVYLGNKQIDEIYVDSKQRLEIRSGGQVNA